jgi:hypothetical protein
MTPQEKAIELVEKYYHLFSVELENTIDYREAKQCALIAVDEILKTFDITTPSQIEYWHFVEQEIEKL